MKSFLHSLTFTLLVLACPKTTFAQWSTNPNANNPVSTANNHQLGAKSVSDGAGGVIIAWYDVRSGAGYDIYAQRINASGVVQWTADGVAICIAAGQQAFSTITSDNAGGAIITWVDNRSGPGDIYAQRINASGAVQWTANGVAICNAANNQFNPTIISDNAGGAIITWYDFRSGVNYDIYARRINASGVVQWTADGVALCIAANDQHTPTITSDNTGGAIIAWQDLRNGADYDIYASRVNASGIVQWTADGVAICTSANNQDAPIVVSDNAGGAIIVWSDNRSGTNSDIYAQRINEGGSVQWTVDGAAICTATNFQNTPTIVSDATSGGGIIAWQDLRSGVDYDIYAQRINSSGAVQWLADGWPICFAANDQRSPAIVGDNAGGAIISWRDFRGGTNYDIYAQRINSNGLIPWSPDGAAISTAPGSQDNVTITADGAGGAIIVWDDLRSGATYDVYAQKADYHGYLGNPAPQITGVRDIINDQGGRVNVFWNRSHLDVRPANEITYYQVWRGASGPGAATNAIVLSREDFVKKLGYGESVQNILWTADPLTMNPSTIYWEFYDYATPHQLANYYIPMNTLSDSAQQGVYQTFAMVTAVSGLGYYWDSAPDSGYSVDNLSPLAPQNPVASSLGNGIARLKWDSNRTDPDVSHYQIYRSTTVGFPAADSTRLRITTDTTVVDTQAGGGVTYYYRVAAVDLHGNEGIPTPAFSVFLVRADVRFFLGGPYDIATQQMNKTLNTTGYLAARYPSARIHPNAVDSVTIEIRNAVTGAGSTIRKFWPAWLLTDGSIRDFSDTTRAYVEFDAPTGSYYIVIHHANHIPVMSANFQTLSNSSARYDFSASQSQAYGTSPMLPVGARFVLYPGDANMSRIVSAADANSVFGALNFTGYSTFDTNMSGIVSAADANIVFGNLNQAIQVP